MSADNYNVLFMMVMGESSGDVMAKDARLYPRSLNATEIRQLAQDPDVRLSLPPPRRFLPAPMCVSRFSVAEREDICFA
jgi:hypothetical protein